MSKYCQKWYLKLPTTSDSSIFQLKNYFPQYQFQVHVSVILISFDLHLGVTLDQSLSFRHHIEKLKNKMTPEIALAK